jgi:hypothetical protein
MKKLVQWSLIGIGGTLLGLVLWGPIPDADAGESCYNCSKGSTADQCKQRGGDTNERRKKCEAAGCKIAGTGMCSTASNVKVIDPG